MVVSIITNVTNIAISANAGARLRVGDIGAGARDSGGSSMGGRAIVGLGAWWLFIRKKEVTLLRRGAQLWIMSKFF